MRTHTTNCKGYSLVEMLLATVLVISLSAVSYRVLKTITGKQSTNVTAQKTNKEAQIASDRFKNDISMVDYNWVRYGIASIYPHPGYGFDRNYYTDGSIRSVEALNDGITFLRRDPSNDRLYDIDESKRLCYPAAQTTKDLDLYGNTLSMVSTDGLHDDDWVLVYQAGKYAIAMIQQVNSNLVTLVPPLTNAEQKIGLDANSVITGFVSRPGVVPANMDFHANLNAQAADDTFCFDVNAPQLQKIANPVSYFVDYRTTDGEEKSAGNSYILDKQGNPQKMLVRVEHKKSATKREYIANIDQVEFTYDLIEGKDPTMPGGVIRNVGHDSTDPHMLGLLANVDPDHSDLVFESTNKIVAVKMNLRLASEGTQNGAKDWKQSQEIKVALDPSLKEDIYRDSMDVLSFLTDDLNTIPFTKGGPTSTYSEQSGKPLYLANGASADAEILVPVSTFELDQYGALGPNSEGQVYVYDHTGCAVNATFGCDPSANRSSIQFTLGTGQTFFPNNVNQILLADGTVRITVGGVGVSTASGAPVRTPMMGIIDLLPGETLKDKFSGNPSSQCNIPNCSIQTINTSQTGLENFTDTANISVDQAKGDIYVATMTKTTNTTDPNAIPSSIYKGEWNGTDFTYTKFTDVSGTDDGRIVSAISDRLVEAGGEKYLVACLTKKVSCGATTGECLDDSNGAIPGVDDPSNDVYGRIQLIKSDGTKIVLMKHNYRCSSINVDNNNNLIIGGRLSAQPITNEQIRNALTDSTYLADLQKKVLYLDEVGEISGGVAKYADYFKVDSSTYTDSFRSSNTAPPTDAQYIGWLTGMSTFQYPDGTFGMANANKYKLDPGVGRNSSAAVKEYANAGIQEVNLAGMTDRVVATIETDQGNLNGSRITAVYNSAISEIPEIYIPGQFYMNNPSAARTTPTPLPSVSPGMSDESWIQLYRQMLSPQNNTGLNAGMPSISAAMADVATQDTTEFNCKRSYPKCTVN